MTGKPDEFILPDGARQLTRFDVARFRRHHQRLARRFRDEVKRRRELEAECEHLKKVLVEVQVRWYGSGAFYGALGHGDDVGEDNPGDG